MQKLLMLIALAFAPGSAAAVGTDFFAGLDAFDRGEYAIALTVWEPLAEGGDAESQFRLARLYLEGKGTEPDDSRAVHWYRRAAKQGHARAQGSLGFMLETGRGARPEIDAAVRWYTAAAEQGRASAQSNLGRIYLEGLLGSADVERAIQWYRRAAEQGNPMAQTALGRLHESGRGLRTDPEQAFRLYKKAARNNFAEAQFRLARMYAEGRGTARNASKALKQYERAAMQGHAEAQTALNALYEPEPPVADLDEPPPEPAASVAEAVVPERPDPAATPRTAVLADDLAPHQQFERGHALLLGKGLPRDPQRAEDWFRRAAERGHGEAAYRLALMLYRGDGASKKNFMLAYVWFSRAAERGVHDATRWSARTWEKLHDDERAEAHELLSN